MIYYLIVFILFVLSLINEAKLSPFLKICVLISVSSLLVLFAGLRGDIEGDYSSYLDIFNNSAGRFHWSDGIEPGFFYLNHFVNRAGLPFQIIIMLMACFSIIPKTLFLFRKSSNFLFSILIYYCTCYFIFDFVQIRQAVTIGIFMISLAFIQNRKFFKYLLSISLASVVHLSVLVLLPAYFFLNRKISAIFLYFIVCLCSILNVFQITVPLMNVLIKIVPIPDISANKLAVYMKDSSFSAVSGKQMLLGILFIFIRGRIRTNDGLLNILINLFVLGIVLTTIFNGIPELAFRMKWYCFWSEALLMVYTIEYFSFDRLSIKFLLYFGLAIFYVFGLSTILNEYATRGEFIFPYRIFSL
ncbi:EpsG family protein [Arcticibacter tournemirensis]